MKKLGDVLKAMAEGEGPIALTFKCMGIAEEVIKASSLTKAQSSRAFQALCPSEVLQGKSADLYRAHARELVSRVSSGADLRPATDAECLAALSDTSQVAPLERNAAAAMEALFARVFPEKKIDGEPLPGGAWPTAVDEVIAVARKKLAAESRGEGALQYRKEVARAR